MDNVVQTINIEDIVPSKFEPSIEEKQKIEELAILIKNFDILEPILVRPKNGKYEIILGMDKYQASLIAKKSTVPVIVKEIDDDVYSKYSNIDTNRPKSSNTLPKDTFSKIEKNSDIVNLSELSKIKLEYERNDTEMNNGQFNNTMNNNFNQPNIGGQNEVPTFGGKFFPSLEDEPTNMNMGGGFNTLQTPPIMPNLPSDKELNNNLIDLTDLSLEKETTSMPNLGNEPLKMPTMEPMPNFNINQTPNNFDMSNLGTPPTQSTDTILNLDNLQNNNQSVRPINESVSMDILNADFGVPQSPINPTNMGNNNFNVPQNQEFNNNPNPTMPNLGMNQSVIEQPMSQFNSNSTMVPNYGNVEPTPIMNQPSTKDVTPVTNTIKNLVTSLEAFGYKINLTEENLPTISKLTIEIEK